ncbi:MAG: hypothetical protein E7319_01290 [Clostridiales bacterium]|nr:hypothetical protein [Clostridiales bacterium]
MTRHSFLRLIAFTLAMILVMSVAVTALAAYATIPYGAKGDEVRKMQTVLRQKGYYKGRVDGVFGPSTRSAVIAFQKSISIAADGKPGNKTLTALYHGSSAINTPSNGDIKSTLNIQNPHSIYYGMSGEKVRALQQALRKAGYYNAVIDGVFGDNTLRAVKLFQSKHGLKADGIAGVQTQAKLNAVNNSKPQMTAYFVLGMGSNCSEVRSLQSYLVGKGYGPSTDPNGYFGSNTQSMLKAWQQDNGYKVTGTMTESVYNNTVAAP